MDDEIDISMEDFLEHYGVKGMKWGVINEDRSSGNSSKSNEEKIAEYKAVPKPKVTKKEAAKNIAANEEKFAAKFGPKEQPGADSSGEHWRPTGKQVAVAAVGAAFVGYVAYNAYSQHQLRVEPGTTVDADHYRKLVGLSKNEAWSGKGYLTDEALAREGFTIPVGNTFHRISTSPEASPSSLSGMYATHNKDDFNRYVAGFRGEVGYASKLYHVEFDAAKEMKVPSTMDALETMRGVLSKEFGREASAAEAKSAYQAMSGTAWGGSRATDFFKELSNKGYSAIVDEMDAGVIGETPLYVFDKKALGPYRHKVLTVAAMEKAESEVKELSNRKPPTFKMPGSKLRPPKIKMSKAEVKTVEAQLDALLGGFKF